jgi:hypothetical protein
MHPLEKRREMSGTFPGRIQLAEGDEVDVDLQIAAEKIRLATPFAEIGLWDRDSIHFERSSTTGGYELSVADDVVTFFPTDVDAFAEAVDEMLSEAGSSGDVIRPVSLVPSLLDEDGDQGADDSLSPVARHDTEDEPSRFGPSSRERLVAAMAGFKERQEAEEAEKPEEDAEAEVVEAAAPQPEAAGFDAIDEADPDTAIGRTSSRGFVIPGDDDYRHPADGDDYEDDYEDDYDDHPISFDEDLEEDTVADQILETSRSLRGARTLSIDKAKLRKAGIAVAVIAVMAALAFAVPVVIDFFSSSDDGSSPATASQTTVPVTAPQETTPPTTEPTVDPTPTVEPLAFDLTSSAFVERWNETAALVSPNLRFRSSLPASDFEVGFTAHIAMVGRFGGLGSGIEAYTIEIDPTGPAASDRLGIQALGLAIAVADPSLEPNERAAVLAETGLNVRDPQLGGLNGTTTWNDVNYRLVYDAEDVVLRLTISPRSP